MENFEYLVTAHIMDIKTNIHDKNSLSIELIEALLGSYLHQTKTIKILEKQLYYALETGGSYLEMDEIVN